jgi:hypothetical protein
MHKRFDGGQSLMGHDWNVTVRNPNLALHAALRLDLGFIRQDNCGLNRLSEEQFPTKECSTP